MESVITQLSFLLRPTLFRIYNPGFGRLESTDLLSLDWPLFTRTVSFFVPVAMSSALSDESLCREPASTKQDLSSCQLLHSS